MTLPIVYHPHYMAPLRQGHRFPMSKYGYLRDALIARGLLPAEAGYIAPAPASLSQIARVHDLGYVERAFDERLTDWEQREIGLPGTERVVRRARLSAAGTTLAARLALEHGIACNAAGGSHHAGPDKGAGFCVFNDVAVAARTLVQDGHVARVLVVDLDVHQGDGTAQIFAQDPTVFTLSIHAAKNYPARKAVSDLDVALPDHTGDAAYLATLRDTLMPLLDRVAPDLVFYNAGVDVHQADKLGRLSLSDAGLRARDRSVIEMVRARAIPLVGVLGGGYDEDQAALGARHAVMFEEAALSMQMASQG
ncbi:MAG: histone deacetylase [Pseudomonadota bacterium]